MGKDQKTITETMTKTMIKRKTLTTLSMLQGGQRVSLKARRKIYFWYVKRIVPWDMGAL